MSKIKIGISIGDINGIGIEVILKTFTDKRIFDLCTPVVYGSSKVMAYHKNITKLEFQYNNVKSVEHCSSDRLNVMNCWNENVNINLGKPTEISGKYAAISLDRATDDLQNGLIDAVVTAPINKEAMKMAKFPFPGHTEYLAKKFAKGKSLMLLVNDDLRVGVATGHIPINQVGQKLNKGLLLQKIKMMNHSLHFDFGIERPTIAVLGLNPHAGDNGVIGKEEEQMIRPAIIESKKNGVLAMGPYPADGFWGSGLYKKFDGILAIYHDQGLIPFKLLSFGAGVNVTAGMNVVRTSPDHGTAYEIVGKNQANPASFRKALFTALDIARNRSFHAEANENKLEKRSAKLKQVEARAEDLVEE
ncbi:MAG: 4-hydroxythreonine-4-phosphate dehydrogenase PdxA [Bacteroidota bacterium]